MILNVRNLSDPAYDVLLDRIVSRQIAPGDPIRQDVIAGELGISKVPLREALARLEQTGLVESSPRKGFIAKPLSPREAEDVYFTRILLEPPTAALACTRASTTDRDMVDAELRRLSGKAEPKLSATARLRMSLLMLRPAGRDIIEHIVVPLFYRSERYRAASSEEVVRDAPGLRDLLTSWRDAREKDVLEIYRSRLFERLRRVTLALAGGG